MSPLRVVSFLACLAVAFCAVKQKAYIRQDLRKACQPFPDSEKDVCPMIKHEVHVFLLEEGNNLAGQTKMWLSHLTPDEKNSTCLDAIKELVCTSLFPNCTNNEAPKFKNMTCPKKIPNGDECSEQTKTVILQSICATFKHIPSEEMMPECVAKPKGRDKKCPSLKSYKKVVQLGKNETGHFDKVRAQVLVNASEQCKKNMEELRCVVHNPVCEDKDGFVGAYLMARETCEEKVKECGVNVSANSGKRQQRDVETTLPNNMTSMDLGGDMMNMTYTVSEEYKIPIMKELCDDLPWKNATTIDLTQQDTSGGQKVPLLGFFVQLLALGLAAIGHLLV